MLKKLIALLLVCLLLAGCAPAADTTPDTTAQDSVATEPSEETVPVATESPEEAQVLKILIIGNSQSSDATMILYDVFKAHKPEQQVVLGHTYYPDASIEVQAGKITLEEKVFEYRKNTNGTWEKTTDLAMKKVLKDDQWDIVVLQEDSFLAGMNASFDNIYIQAITGYVDSILEHPHKFLWNMTWACSNDDTFYAGSYVPQPPEGFKDNFKRTYNYSSGAQLQQMITQVNNHILTKDQFAGVIPSGTAVQYAHIMLDIPQTELYRDYTHLLDFGRTLVAYLWYAQLTGETLTEVKLDIFPEEMRPKLYKQYGDLEITEEMKQIIVETVNGTLKAPLELPVRS